MGETLILKYVENSKQYTLYTVQQVYMAIIIKNNHVLSHIPTNSAWFGLFVDFPNPISHNLSILQRLCVSPAQRGVPCTLNRNVFTVLNKKSCRRHLRFSMRLWNSLNLHPRGIESRPPLFLEPDLDLTWLDMAWLHSRGIESRPSLILQP